MLLSARLTKLLPDPSVVHLTVIGSHRVLKLLRVPLLVLISLDRKLLDPVQIIQIKRDPRRLVRQILLNQG